MSSVVKFVERVPRRPQSDIKLSCPDLGLVTAIAQIDRTQFVSKECVQQALVLLVQSSERTQQIIGQIQDEEVRMRLMAHADKIRELVEEAGRRAAEL